MFRPNNRCQLQRRAATRTIFGRAVFGRAKTVPCSIVKLTVTAKDSSVRADSSASRGAAEQIEADAVLLFPRNVEIAINDVVTVEGIELRAIGLHKRFNAAGKFDHTQASFVVKERDE